MMNLAEYRRSRPRLADFLPWAALVDEGVVLNKDGSFQRTARFRGPDLDCAAPAELVGVAGRLNNALRRLGSGWAIFVEAQRHPASHYPQGHFPDAASALVDAERRAEFEEEGAHFECSYFLTLLCLPPAEDAARAEGLLYEGRDRRRRRGCSARCCAASSTAPTACLQLVEGFMPEGGWLDDDETLTYLHSTVSTKRQRVRVPETPMYLDALLADQPLTGGLEPRLGNAHLRMLTIVGFPTVTTPGILDELNRLAFPYRWSTRAIMLDKTDATRLLTKIRRQWFAKRKSIAAILKEVMTNEASTLARHRRPQQGDRCRRGAAGARLRRDRRGLCHRHRHGLGRRSPHRRREAAPGREGDPGPRLHLHGRERERGRSLARLAARPCLRQCPPAADLDAQSRPHDPALGGLGGPGPRRAFRARRRCSSARPRARRRSASRCMSAMSAIRWWSVRPAPASRCCWR